MKRISNANRGMNLEKLIDKTNKFYSKIGAADVRKIPTPVKIMSVNGGRISGVKQNGYLVDYIGVVNGNAIAFDAKETKLKSFPLANLHENQFRFMQEWNEHGADVFLIIHFKELGVYYKVDFDTISAAVFEVSNGGRKSIPMKTIEKECREIFVENGILNYI